MRWNDKKLIAEIYRQEMTKEMLREFQKRDGINIKSIIRTGGFYTGDIKFKRSPEFNKPFGEGRYWIAYCFGRKICKVKEEGSTLLGTPIWKAGKYEGSSRHEAVFNCIESDPKFRLIYEDMKICEVIYEKVL